MNEDRTGSTTKSTEATTQRIAVSTPLSPVPPYATSSLFTYTTPTSATSSLPTSSNTVKTLTVTNASSPPRKLIKPTPALIKQTPALKPKPVLNADMTSKVLTKANKTLVYHKEVHGMGPRVSKIAF